MQDEDTRYVCIGPVNKTINMLACWFEDPEGDAFKRSALPHLEYAPSDLVSQFHNGRAAYYCRAPYSGLSLNQAQASMQDCSTDSVDDCECLKRSCVLGCSIALTCCVLPQPPATVAGLPVAGGGRHEDAGIQRQPAVGHSLRSAGLHATA